MTAKENVYASKKVPSLQGHGLEQDVNQKKRMDALTGNYRCLTCPKDCPSEASNTSLLRNSH